VSLHLQFAETTFVNIYAELVILALRKCMHHYVSPYKNVNR